VVLGAKDGLALVGSNAVSIALAALTNSRTAQLAQQADLVAALTIETLTAGLSPFDAVVLAARPYLGQQISGARIRAALDGTDLVSRQLQPVSLQDPISIRTVPQVHGVLLDLLSRLDEIVSIELSCAPDNPFLDVERGTFLSNGNFSITGLAVAFDGMRIALAHVAILAERRAAQLIRVLRQGATLTEQIDSATAGGGYVTPVILAQTASSLVAQTKYAAAPLSLTGTIVGDGVEDHASMAYSTVVATAGMLDVIERLFAIEVLLATTVLRTAQRGARVLGPTLSGLVAQIEQSIRACDVTSEVIDLVVEALRSATSQPAAIPPTPPATQAPAPELGFSHPQAAQPAGGNPSSDNPSSDNRSAWAMHGNRSAHALPASHPTSPRRG
jgi:histidine ammonia-lyase